MIWLDRIYLCFLASEPDDSSRCFMGIDVLDFSKAIVLIGSYPSSASLPT